jgi:ABC-type multidrug transport system fused ATPase/permease subunit
MSAAPSTLRGRLAKVWGGYRRFGGLIAAYARPHWRHFLLLLVLNFLVIAATAALTMMTAAVLSALTMPADQLPSHAQAAGGGSFTLNGIGNWVYHIPVFSRLEGRFALVAAFGVGTLLVGVIKSLLGYGASVVAALTGAAMAQSMQQDLFGRVLTFSMRFFHRNQTGEVMSRVSNDTGTAMQDCARVVNVLLVNPFLLAFYLVLVTRTSLVLLAGIALAVVAHHLISTLLSRPLRRYTHRAIDALAQAASVVQEALTNIRVVKVFAAEAVERARFADRLKRLHQAVFRGAVLENVQQPARTVVNQVVQCLILLVAAYEYGEGRIPLKTCLLFVFICQSIVDPIKQIGDAYVLGGRMLATLSRVFELLGTKTDLVDGTRPVAGFHASLRLERVAFAYDEKPVLQGIDLEIRKGEMLALVGPSGGGKSTLTDLVLRLYDPGAGAVRLDGVDIREFRLDEFRRLFGVVSQEPLLFHATLRENILYGRPHLGADDMLRAAHAAHAAAFIEAMPLGYETLVGDRGVRLSGGQRQRIAIARALASRPEILVLDEATSALDSESEREVQRAITEISRTTTSIVIAHRLSTVLHADRIAYVDGGRIVHIGAHEELLRLSPGYRRLCEIQFQAGTAAAEGSHP